MTKQHLMIDLETMGTSVDAAILQIGVVAFSLDEQSVGADFKVNVTMSSNVELGREIDPSTILWWMQQDDEAQNSLIFGQQQAIDLSPALCELRTFIRDTFGDNLKGVWGNGSTFDISMLEQAYRQARIECPWKFWTSRDCRTMGMMAPEAWRPKPKLAHDALSDAIAQAQWMQNCFRELRG